MGLPHTDASVHDADELPAPGRTRNNLTWGNDPPALATQADSERNRAYLILRAERTVVLEQVHTSHPNETK